MALPAASRAPELAATSPVVAFAETVASFAAGSGTADTVAATSTRLARDPALASVDPNRYVVERELARGGMGKISIAYDTTLGRTVAIKELLAPHGPLAARFRRELALTARLQHPAIVSIHDGGQWSDGRLVYVMKLVQGTSLEHVIARHHTVAARLALLPHGIAVCEAIAYAHAQGIIHRDLKPANVLVGDYGETVVIDWGLAKDLRDPTRSVRPPSTVEPDHAHTIDGDIMGTPAYMPPEQARGASVDARADVYALGAVLYHLLAGAPPYTGKRAMDVITNVLTRDPEPLAARAPGVPADLLAIVNKAMARDPSDRYASAGELAADLKRFQGGQLVGAHRYSTSQHLRRWLRKHRTAVAVGAIAITALVAGGGVSVRRILAEEQAAETARGLADRHRDAAEQNSREAEGLTTFMLTSLRDQLVPLGKLELMKSVGERVHAYYANQREAFSPTNLELRAQALLDLGGVFAAQGDGDRAIADYRKARDLEHAATVLSFGNAEGQRNVAQLDALIASEQLRHGDLDGALTSARAAVDAMQTVSPDAAVPSRSTDLAGAYDMLGMVLAARGQSAEALAALRTSMTYGDRYARDHQQEAEAWRSLSIGHNKIGDLLSSSGDHAGAIAEYRASAAIAAQVVAAAPDDAVHLRDLSIARARLGSGLSDLGDLHGAIGEHRAALAIAERLAARDPGNAEWKLDLTQCHDELGQALAAAGDTQGALAEYERALPDQRALVARDPGDVTYARNLVVGYLRIGDVQQRRGQLAPAIANLRTALALAEANAKRAPADHAVQTDLADARQGLDRALAASRVSASP